MQELNALAARVWKRVAAGEAYKPQPKPMPKPPQQPQFPWLLTVFLVLVSMGGATGDR